MQLKRLIAIFAIKVCCAAPATALDLPTYSDYAWKAAISLSGAPPALAPRLRRPAVVIYDTMRVEEATGGYNRLCGELIVLQVVDEGAFRVREYWEAAIYAYPRETRLAYEAMIHEFLHYISFEMLKDDPTLRRRYLGGSEQWVREHFPQVRCEWPR
jgi:hypothetical protein